MSTPFRIRYYARKSLLMVFGPAELDRHLDPLKRLEQARIDVFGPSATKATKVHVPKRHMSEGQAKTQNLAA